jgi:hypothetical protein
MGVCRVIRRGPDSRLAADVELHPSVEVFALGQANEALARLRSGRPQGAAVLVPSQATRST